MALTLPSSNGASFHTTRPATIQLNSHFNGGLTQTTATVTPTRLKNIEEAFLEHSSQPPKPVLHEHMAGFVTPSVNISLFVKPPANFNNLNNLSHFDHQPIQPESQQSKSFDHYYNSSTNSNSNDSFAYSEDYSSEASSNALDNSNISFSNLIVDMNSSSSSSRGKKSSNATTITSKSRSKSSQLAMAGSSQKQPKKSTGGGRKPTKNDKLTPEEEMKRAKRRERNKLAAARCRKRRLDQTNDLSERTLQLENDHEQLVDTLNSLLTQMTRLKKTIEAHEERNCKSKTLRLQVDVFSKLDFEVMSDAMKPLMDEDSLSEMPGMSDDVASSPPQPSMTKIKVEPVNSIVPAISSATSVIVPNSNNLGMMDFASAFSQQPLSSIMTEPDNSGPMLAGSQKRKRPNSLPVSSAYKPTESSTNPDALQTPSHGLIFAESTGLTPLVPTLTPSVLMTPSTMAAFVKSLGSPSDEPDQKKLIAI